MMGVRTGSLMALRCVLSAAIAWLVVYIFLWGVVYILNSVPHIVLLWASINSTVAVISIRNIY